MPAGKKLYLSLGFTGFLAVMFFASRFTIRESRGAPWYYGSDTLHHPQVYILGDRLRQYGIIKGRGGWPQISAVQVMVTIGTRSAEVSLLRKRLVRTGDLLKNPWKERDLFNEELKRALERFQVRHGLPVSGTANKQTVEAMNVPVEQRMEEIKINMERWKSMPAYMGEEYVLVNIADYELQLVENDSVRSRMKVMVGRPYRETPVFTSQMTHLVFNPAWTVPPNILKNDILPLIRKDRNYVQRRNIHFFRLLTDGRKEEVDSDEIDFDELEEQDFPYELVQEPGVDNPMGFVKFVFPNPYNVYLHDTPSRELFEKGELAASSGCIRVSRAIELAEHLLEKVGWTRAEILKVIGSGETLTVRLYKPVPVYLQYFTCWVDEYGRLNFRKDIYGRDEALRGKL